MIHPAINPNRIPAIPKAIASDFMRQQRSTAEDTEDAEERRGDSRRS
jgi:hypothetical protein